MIKSIVSLFFLGIVWNFLSSSIPANISVKPQLKDVVQNSLKNSQGEYAVAIKNLKTGESYFYNQHKKFEAASLYKLWVMVEGYDQIKHGKINKDQISGEINQMIVFSDNDSGIRLWNELGFDNIQSFLKNSGFKESDLDVAGDYPITTAYDIELFFEKLYKEKLADKKDTEEMLSLLKNQQVNNKIPKYLPKNVVIAHKTGELDNFSHDAGIVYSKKGDYVIVVLSKTDNPQEADDKIAKISKAVYDYFK